MNTSERIKSLRLSNLMTQKDLSLRVNSSVVTVQCWENGTKNPSMDAIIALSRVFNVSTDYLLGINTDNLENPYPSMSKQEHELISEFRMLDKHGRKLVRTVCSMEKSRILDSQSNSEAEKPIRYIPRYITPSAAGMSVPLEGNDFEMIVADNSVPSKADFAVKIQGDSMLPYIADGDTVYVERTHELNIGEVGIFSVDGAMYCKQYYADGKRNVTLVSANQEFQNTNIYIDSNCNSSLVCFGKVLLNNKVEMPSYFAESTR